MPGQRVFPVLKPAKKQQTKADIVFCMDATYSMKPSFDGIRNAITTFVEGLRSAADVDFRLRLFAYRDRHDTDHAMEPWHIFPFTSSVTEFVDQLSQVEPSGGGDMPESTLDALYQCIHSDWRKGGTHRTIILVTDDNTHPTLLPSTYNRPDNDIRRVIQDLQEMKHSMLYIIAPEYPLYVQLEQAMKRADRKVAAYFVVTGSGAHEALAQVPWEPLLKMLGETISQSSLMTGQDQIQ